MKSGPRPQRPEKVGASRRRARRGKGEFNPFDADDGHPTPTTLAELVAAETLRLAVARKYGLAHSPVVDADGEGTAHVIAKLRSTQEQFALYVAEPDDYVREKRHGDEVTALLREALDRLDRFESITTSVHVPGMPPALVPTPCELASCLLIQADDLWTHEQYGARLSRHAGKKARSLVGKTELVMSGHSEGHALIKQAGLGLRAMRNKDSPLPGSLRLLPVRYWLRAWEDPAMQARLSGWSRQRLWEECEEFMTNIDMNYIIENTCWRTMKTPTPEW